MKDKASTQSEPAQIPRDPAQIETTMAKEARLMKAAQRFSSAFDEDRHFGDSAKRLEYTLAAWRELALAALDYAKEALPTARS